MAEPKKRKKRINTCPSEEEPEVKEKKKKSLYRDRHVTGTKKKNEKEKATFRNLV